MAQLLSEHIDVVDEFEAVQSLYLEHGWTDGLPVVPPTPDRVETMLSATDLPPQHVLAELPPTWGAATVEKLAVNAVMAGCLPEYLPVLVAAVEAISDSAFNLYAIQATTHPCAPLVIINGPIRSLLGLNSSSGSYGPGWRANATIGRALRLVLFNVGGGYPGVGDMSTQGAPSKFSYCVAENEEENPWQPLHVDRGFRPDQSTVTVLAGEPPHNINDHSGRSAEDILTIIAGAMAVTGANNAYTGARLCWPWGRNMLPPLVTMASARRTSLRGYNSGPKSTWSVTPKTRCWSASEPSPTVRCPWSPPPMIWLSSCSADQASILPGCPPSAVLPAR